MVQHHHELRLWRYGRDDVEVVPGDHDAVELRGDGVQPVELSEFVVQVGDEVGFPGPFRPNP